MMNENNKPLYMVLIGILLVIVGLVVTIIITKNPPITHSAGDYNDKIIELKESCAEACADEILRYSHEAYQKYQDYYTASLVCENETLYGDQATALQYCQDAKKLLESIKQEDILRD